jgi:hypothetical protein
LSDQSFGVVWVEPGQQPPAAGTLALADGHATLTGSARGEERLVEFEPGEVERIAFVAQPAERLNNRPTLAIALSGRGLVLIGEFAGFGIVAEVANALGSWVAG